MTNTRCCQPIYCQENAPEDYANPDRCRDCEPDYHSQVMPVFTAVDKFVIAGRGTVYTGQCPADFTDRSRAIGFEIMFEGKKRKIKALESFARLTGPHIGEGVGIMFEDVG